MRSSLGLGNLRCPSGPKNRVSRVSQQSPAVVVLGARFESDPNQPLIRQEVCFTLDGRHFFALEESRLWANSGSELP
jgi:hypothetical protein